MKNKIVSLNECCPSQLKKYTEEIRGLKQHVEIDMEIVTHSYITEFIIDKFRFWFTDFYTLLIVSRRLI